MSRLPRLADRQFALPRVLPRVFSAFWAARETEMACVSAVGDCWWVIVCGWLLVGGCLWVRGTKNGVASTNRCRAFLGSCPRQ